MKCSPVVQFSFQMDALVCIRCGRVMLTMESLFQSGRLLSPLDEG